MGNNSYSFRNAEALLGAESYRLGWTALRWPVSGWIGLSLVCLLFTKQFDPSDAEDLNELILPLAALPMWFYFVPAAIRAQHVEGTSTAALTVKVFGRSILLILWNFLIATAPAIILSGLAIYPLFQEGELLVPPDYGRGLTLAAIWLATTSALNLAIFGVRAGWRVSLIAVGGILMGLALSFISVFLTSMVGLDAGNRFSLGLFMAGQTAILPFGVAILGWAIRATVGHARTSRSAG